MTPVSGWLTERRLAASVLLGVASALIIWAAYVATLLRHGRRDLAMALAWNGPISLVFLVLAWDAVLGAFVLPFRAFLRTYGAVMLVWSVGFLLLYLRLVLKSVDISGHMAWCVVMLTQTIVLGMPRWFTVVAALVLFEVAYFKFAILGGPSGTSGLVVGLGLATLLAVLSRRWRSS